MNEKLIQALIDYIDAKVDAMESKIRQGEDFISDDYVKKQNRNTGNFGGRAK